MNHSAPAAENRALRDSLIAGLGAAVGIVLSRNFFENEKKVTQKIEVGYGVDDHQFCRTVSQFLGPPLVGGNDIQVLEDGAEIFPAMIDAIKSARRTITFENFVFGHGRITSEFAAALADRARNGVKVHFLQDAIGCDCIHGEEMKLMKASGVQVEIFRYFHLRFNERTHRKLLIIDGSLGFIGGAAIADDWDGHGIGPQTWHDIQYRVEGPVVAQMQQAFLDNWVQTRGCLLHGDEYFPLLQERGKLTCQAFQSSSCEGADSARLMYLYSMAAARRSIHIANAYFIPDDLLVDTIVRARNRGVEVEVVTAGPLLDRQWVRFAGRSRWRSMLEAGVRFYEYEPGRYHCKYMIVDDAWTCVGSCNFDSRSLRLNDEANLNVLDPTFGREHNAIFERDKAASREITLVDWRRRPIGEKIKGHATALFRSQL